MDAADAASVPQALRDMIAACRSHNVRVYARATTLAHGSVVAHDMPIVASLRCLALPTRSGDVQKKCPQGPRGCLFGY
jgi:hypothetical protein